ncbi:hypothetical protein NPIL_122881 [Nephila pilipes]|uniref:Uncharacterized protein n=1 Tax=Nephila pilipes TaxID=299642 RepID=A0A8X6I4Z6_NEPPI|nr:hypothetical protein NPIL_122881 [Nephila pilipes]
MSGKSFLVQNHHRRRIKNATMNPRKKEEAYDVEASESYCEYKNQSHSCFKSYGHCALRCKRRVSLCFFFHEGTINAAHNCGTRTNSGPSSKKETRPLK